MIWHGLVMVVAVATTMTVLAFALSEYYRKIVACSTALFLWLAAAAGSPTISFEYTKIFENAADNSYEIIEGVHHISGPVSWLSYAWLGMAIIVGLYLWYSVSAEAQKQSEKIGG